MNWKLILQLSMFGLAMGIATVFVIGSRVELWFWLPTFLICAYFIATRCSGLYFIHGVLLGLANSVWVSATHVLLFSHYMATHSAETKMMQSMPTPNRPRLMMIFVGPMVGLMSGLLIGLLAVITRRVVKPQFLGGHGRHERT